MTSHAERHLLVIDDDDRIRELLKQYLGRAGFRVTAVRNAATARRLVARLEFDLLVVDVMMPGEDGFAFTAWLRSLPGPAGRAPILILTARGLPDDRIEGLGLGADDYLGKPFEPRELILRVEAILRRAERLATVSAAPLRMGDCAFDAVRGELTRGNATIRLTGAETRLLRQLAGAPNVAVDRISLSENAEASGRAVDIQVTRLRRKIEADPGNPRYLRTARGVGYMLTPD